MDAGWSISISFWQPAKAGHWHLPGIGEKSQAAILEAAKQMTHLQERIPYKTALKRATDCVKF